VKAAIGEVNRDVSIEFTTLATKVDESISRERLLATLAGFFGALALLLATVGFYGVMSHNVARRRNEIAIRMALGAERAVVLRMVLGEAALLIGIGMAVGLGLAVAMTRFVASFLYGLAPNDPPTFFWRRHWRVLARLPDTSRRGGHHFLDPMTALREE
jgi:ABC-type antimicrobial peptide transport system permease subunit